MTDLTNLNELDFELDYRDESELSDFFLQTQQSSKSGLDPDDVSFRKVKNGEFFLWNKPRYTKEKEENEIPELTSADQVVAVRGILIKAQFGFNFYEEGNNVPICQTTQADYGSERLTHHLPLLNPIYQPFGSKNDPERIVMPREELYRYNLQGARGKSCAQCVIDGDHYKGTIAQNGARAEFKGDICSFTCGVFFCVYSLGVLVSNDKMLPSRKVVKVKSIEWKNVSDMVSEVIDSDGNTLQIPRFGREGEDTGSPFIIRVRPSVSGAFSKVNGKDFHIDRAHGSYLPPDNELFTLKDYLEYLRADPVCKRNQVVRQTKDNRIVYRMPTDIYFVKASEDSSRGLISSNGVPVFHPLMNDYDSQSVDKMVAFAHHVYQSERKLSGNIPEPLPRPIPEGEKALPTPTAPPATLAPERQEPKVVKSSLPAANGRASLDAMLENLPTE